MRFALALPLAVFGMLLLATPALPVGLALILGAWWVYERTGSRRASDDVLPALVFVVGGGYATWLVVSAAASWLFG